MKIGKYILGFFCLNFTEVWISTLYEQLNVALYEAIWSYPVHSLLTFGLLATETSLNARMYSSFRAVSIFFQICASGPFLWTRLTITFLWNSPLWLKKSLFSVTIPNLLYLLIRTLHISHRDNRLRALKWSVDLINISFVSCQNFPKSEKSWLQIIWKNWSSLGFALKQF